MIASIVTDDAGHWDQYVAAHPDGTIFHTTAWLRLCAQHQKLKLVRLAFVKEGQWVGVCPFFTKRLFGVKVAASPFVVEDTPYLGPLVTSEAQYPAIIQAMERALFLRLVNFTRILLRRPAEAVHFDSRYRRTIRHTHMLSLSGGADAVWKGMEGRARTAIRKAEREGVMVRFADDPALLDRYYSLLEAIFQRYGMVPPNPKVFYRDILWGLLAPHARLIVAEQHGNVIACAIVLMSRKTLYYLDAVSDKAYNSLSPSSAVQWFIIQWAMKEGFTEYDFVGSDMPWLAKFKESFGGTLDSYVLLERASPAWVFRLRDLYGERIKPGLHRLKLASRSWHVQGDN